MKPCSNPVRLAMVSGFLSCLSLVWLAACSHAHDHGHTHAEGHPHDHTMATISESDLKRTSREMATAAKALVASLTPEQKVLVGIPFKNDERMNWNFVPLVRKGLTLKAMTEEQRKLTWTLVQTGLSQIAADKVRAIISLEPVLSQIEGPRGTQVRDSELYYTTVFGDPGAGGKEPWGWRFEGHHVAFNFTIVGDEAIFGAPNFLGANPALVRGGARDGTRILADEEDFGRALVKSLTPAQRTKAIYTQTAPRDIITGNQRQVTLTTYQGISYTELDESQKANLVKLIELYATRLRRELAENDMKRIKAAGLDKVYFGWAGGIEPAQPHYYRIHSPIFLVEYDNTQNNNNHIHSVWRDLENDFGGDALKKHYEEAPHDPSTPTPSGGGRGN